MALKKQFIPKSSKVLLGTDEARIRNDRQVVFQLVRDLVQAQFDRGDEELTKRLWQDVADREIDLDRVINLMYTCSFHEDENRMNKVDETYQKTGLVGLIIRLNELISRLWVEVEKEFKNIWSKSY